MIIDLHLHSSCSDGQLTPTELVRRAKTRNVSAIALTDHDTVAGNGEALEAGNALGVTVIPGVEFSVQIEEAAVHILGYGISTLDGDTVEAMKKLKEGREHRLTRMVSRLNDLGIPISSAEVRKEAGGDIIGRLHVARALAKRRAVSSVREAFSQYLGRGGKAYVERHRLSAAEAVGLIHSMGAVAVLAHPGVIERENPGRFGGLFNILVDLGLDGLEAHYSTHTVEQCSTFARIAAERGMLVTGGSDFHRPDPNGPEIGSGTGRLSIPPETLDALIQAIEKRRKPKADDPDLD